MASVTIDKFNTACYNMRVHVREAENLIIAPYQLETSDGILDIINRFMMFTTKYNLEVMLYNSILWEFLYMISASLHQTKITFQFTDIIKCHPDEFKTNQNDKTIYTITDNTIVPYVTLPRISEQASTSVGGGGGGGSSGGSGGGNIASGSRPPMI